MAKSWRLCIRMALMAFLAAALLGQSSLAGTAGVSTAPAGSSPVVNPKAALTATWLITWSTSSRYLFDVEAADGAYFHSDYALT